MMDTRLLRSLIRLAWQYRLFDTADCPLTDGTAMAVAKSGIPRYGEGETGPDFTEAEITLDHINLYGSIRTDARSSDWRAEGSLMDKAFEGVILHVVDEQDVVLMRGGREVRTLVLRPGEALVEKYEVLIRSCGNSTPCVELLSAQDDLQREAILSRVLADRMRRKSDEVLALNRSLGGDWNETAYVLFMRTLGMGEMKISYEALARSLPYRYIVACGTDAQQAESLLLGQSGHLGVMAPDTRIRMLQDIYLGLKMRYALKRPVADWRGSSIRPVSLPLNVLQQTARFLADGRGLLLQRILSAVESPDSPSPSPAVSSATPRGTGEAVRDVFSGFFSGEKADLRIINFVIPLLVAYAESMRSDVLKQRAIELYDGIPGENNRYTRHWSAGGIDIRDAFYSQAMVQLSTEYCGRSRCAECPLGVMQMVALHRP